MRTTAFRDHEIARLLRFLREPRHLDFAPLAPFVEARLDHSDMRLDALWPLLFAAWRRVGEPAGLSPLALATLKNRYRAAQARLALQEHFLHELSQALPSLGVRAALLKGAAFAATLYAPEEPRLGADCDLLVTPPNVDPLSAWLLGQGFSLAGDYEAGPRRRARFFFRVLRRELPWPLEIDLHLACAEPDLFALHSDALLASAAPHPGFIGGNLLVPTPEWSLLLLAVQVLRDMRLLPQGALDAWRLYGRADMATLKALARAHHLESALSVLDAAMRDAFGPTGARPELAADTPCGKTRAGAAGWAFSVAEKGGAYALAGRTLSHYALLPIHRALRFQLLAMTDRVRDRIFFL